jgi:hypothetical protein
MEAVVSEAWWLLLLVPLVTVQAALYAHYRPVWAERGMTVSNRFLALAAGVGAGVGSVVGLTAGFAPGVATSVAVPYLLLAAVTDWRVFLIPREASAFPAWVGGGMLLTQWATGGTVPWPTVLVAVVMLTLFAVLGLFTSTLGMGDVRLLGVAAATLWWLPAVVWLGAVLVAFALLFPVLMLVRTHRTTSGARATCLGPAFAVAFAAGIAITAL